LPDIAWGKRSRVILDVGCGVASFGGYMFDRDVLTMSFAPKDEHEAQVQFALERGIPAISAVMGTKRLPYPSRVFDVIHCARCRVPWHIEGGMLLLELNRLLRPGGYFVWSATPVYQKLPEDIEIWNGTAVTASLIHPKLMQFFNVYISKEHTIILQEHCISISRVAYRYHPSLVRHPHEICVQTLKHIMEISQYCLMEF
jgi:SAM-dependent methyltransferase